MDSCALNSYCSTYSLSYNSSEVGIEFMMPLTHQLDIFVSIFCIYISPHNVLGVDDFLSETLFCIFSDFLIQLAGKIPDLYTV